MTNRKQQRHERAVGMLKDFGLSENEALIYTYLLERGTAVGGSNIGYGTGLHRQYVYVALKTLGELGLVESVSHGKQNRYKAIAPSQVEKIAKRRLLQASDVVRELKTFSTIGYEQDFEVLQGAYAIQQHELEYVRHVADGAHEYIIGGNPDGFERVMGDVLDEYTGMKDKKGMRVFYLGNNSAEAKRYETQSSFHARYLPKLPRGETHMVIRRDTVLFFSFLTPPLAYVISSPVVAGDYKEFFLMLWEMACE